MYRRYTKELLEPIIKESKSWAQVCRIIGIKPMTGSQTNIKKTAVRFGIDFSHFTGQGWNKGLRYRRKPVETYLIVGSTEISHRLKLRLIERGLKENKCEECDISDWNGQELPLELDHINGDHTDNRIENIRILCPNCHAMKTREERKKRSRGATEATLVLETSAIKSV